MVVCEELSLRRHRGEVGLVTGGKEQGKHAEELRWKKRKTFTD